MTLVYRRLRDLIAQRKVTQEYLANKIGLTRQGFSKMLINKSMSIETLEKIADYFKVPMCYFFEDNDEIHKAEDPDIKYENSLMNKYVKALEELNELRKKIGETDTEDET